ncbi:hypothetical protein Cgig2_031264 [Carnegiea gigantea]|uniref:Homeobox-leucine zipper protein n=1 Tax=Carnegiea gigantea TaxID=171969 RepID=A0A9Q1KJA7_9CARY|nr:hypothetical protein Cgig2_031264 [Carnegiea gigantea]
MSTTTTTTTCGGMMAFFPAPNFMLQDSDPHHHHHHPPPSLSSLLPQDFHGGMGIGSMLGKRSMSFSGIDLCEENHENNNNHNLNNNGGGEEELSDDGSQLMIGGGGGEKKRRLNMEQVKTLEKNFELGNKLEPERKVQLAKALGLQPRQIAIWFQNRRARWKTKQLEKDYELLKRQFDALKADNDALLAHNHKLQAEIMALKNREPTKSINLNKETDQGSSSNRSENSSEIKLDISRTPTTTIGSTLDLSAHPATATTTTTATSATASGRILFPPSSMRPTQALFHGLQPPSVKEETAFTNMFCAIDDQNGFWPWLDQQNFN